MCDGVTFTDEFLDEERQFVESVILLEASLASSLGIGSASDILSRTATLPTTIISEWMLKDLDRTPRRWEAVFRPELWPDVDGSWTLLIREGIVEWDGLWRADRAVVDTHCVWEERNSSPAFQE